MAKKVRTGAESKALILDTGAKLAAKYGAKNVTRRMVAKAAKVAESLVTHYVGGAVDAQKLYAKRAKTLGLTLPDEVMANKIGKKLRAHKPGDKRDTRARTPKERVAVAKKSAAGAASAKSAKGSRASKSPAAPRISGVPTGSGKQGPLHIGKPKPKQNKMLPGPAENKRFATLPAPVTIPALPEAGVSIPELPQ